MTDSALSDTIILYVALCYKLNFGFVKSVSLLLDVQPTKKECQYNITYPPLVYQSSFVVSFVSPYLENLDVNSFKVGCELL